MDTSQVTAAAFTSPIQVKENIQGSALVLDRTTRNSSQRAAREKICQSVDGIG